MPYIEEQSIQIEGEWNQTIQKVNQTNQRVDYNEELLKWRWLMSSMITCSWSGVRLSGALSSSNSHFDQQNRSREATRISILTIKSVLELYLKSREPILELFKVMRAWDLKGIE